MKEGRKNGKNEGRSDRWLRGVGYRVGEEKVVVVVMVVEGKYCVRKQRGGKGGKVRGWKPQHRGLTLDIPPHLGHEKLPHPFPPTHTARPGRL